MKLSELFEEEESFAEIMARRRKEDEAERIVRRGQHIKELKALAKIYLENCDWLSPKKPLWRYTTEKDGVAQTRDRGIRPRQNRWEGLRLTSPEWNNFPDRNKSTFCSTTRIVMKGLKSNSLKAVFPFKNQKMGIWKGLDFNEIPFQAGDSLRISFGHAVQHYMKKDVSDFDKLVKVLLAFTDKDFAELMKLQNEDSSKLRLYISSWALEQLHAAQDLFSGKTDKYSPAKLGAEIVSSNKFQVPKESREIWFEGKYLLIGKEYLKEFVQILDGKVVEALTSTVIRQVR